MVPISSQKSYLSLAGSFRFSLLEVHLYLARSYFALGKLVGCAESCEVGLIQGYNSKLLELIVEALLKSKNTRDTILYIDMLIAHGHEKANNLI